MTANNNQTARSFSKEFMALLPSVFQAQSFFGDFFAGGIQMIDGITHNENAFYVKTSDMAVVLRDEYNTDPNVAFGTGTSTSNRFGERQEVIYTDTPVPYLWGWSWHEGIDRHTVNNTFNVAISDRLDLQAQAMVRRFNRNHGGFISEVASKVVNMNGITESELLRVFNSMSAHFTNLEVVGQRVAKVTPDVFNALVDHGLVSTDKNSAVNIDQNTLYMFKGFFLQEVPENLFAGNDQIYAYVTSIGAAFIGIETARTIDAHDFDGVAFQGAGKDGAFVLEDNKEAVMRVTVGGAGASEAKVKAKK